MGKDRVSRLCRELDDYVEEFRSRPLQGAYPYLWLDAKHINVRDRSRVLSKALVIAYAVNCDGVREVIGLDLGEIESEAFWLEFLRALRARGLDGVQLVISEITRASRRRSPGRCRRRGSTAPCTSCATCTATAAATSEG